MIYDCVIVGGGPAGANAALVLGRAKLSVLLIDNNSGRNRVTHESHGFITNDSLAPQVIREKSFLDLNKYPTIEILESTVLSITDNKPIFEIQTIDSVYSAKKIILATGYQEILPNISGLTKLYGTDFFNCVFCDGWELRNQKLAVISENPEKVIDLTTMVNHWSKDLTVFTNGYNIQETNKNLLRNKGFVIDESPILSLEKNVDLVEIITDLNTYQVYGGFVSPTLTLQLDFLSSIELEISKNGLLWINESGETSYKNIYAAGDLHTIGGQLVHAASAGSKVASSIVREIAFEEF